MQSISKRADTLLAALADDNPAPEEKVFARHWFDPMHGLSELRYAAKRGLIRIVESGTIPERFRFLLTDAGRTAAAAYEVEGERSDLSAMQAKLRELVADLAFENPPAVETWISASNFDPLHGAGEIRYACQRQWIEVDGLLTNIAEIRMRLTMRGRDRLAKIATSPTMAGSDQSEALPQQA
jgi:hypothetical protein